MTNHTPNTEQRERAEFEAWSEGHAPGHSRAINENGNYEDYATECAWAGWHARATQAAPASPEPAPVDSPEWRAWRSEKDLRADLDELLAYCEGDPEAQIAFYNVRAALIEQFHSAKPRAPASPNTGAVPVAWRIWRSDRWCFAYSPNRDLHRSEAWEPLFTATPSPSKDGEAGAGEKVSS